jgi:hypothetical protein
VSSLQVLHYAESGLQRAAPAATFAAH